MNTESTEPIRPRRDRSQGQPRAPYNLAPSRIDPASAVPLYRQIYDALRRDLLAGQLEPGRRLVATRVMADELGVSVADYLSMLEESRAHTVRSLSEPWDDGSGDQPVEKIDFLSDPRSPDPAEILNQEDVMRAIIRSLNRREKQIILMYYRDGLTMKQIGSLMTLTESRVCQIHSNVMKKLKVHLEESRGQLSL